MDPSCESPPASAPQSATNARRLGGAYKLPLRASEIVEKSPYVPYCHHAALSPKRYPTFDISVWTDIGNRKTQEDRCTFAPQLIEGRDDCAFFGVFDGTVGDFASENVKKLVVPHLIGSPPWPRIVDLITATDHLRNKTSTNGDNGENGTSVDENIDELYTRVGSQTLQTSVSQNLTEEDLDFELPPLICSAMDWMYLNSDSELISLCAAGGKHYASSTSITVLLLAGFCCVGHLGDSRVALGYERQGRLFGEFLTVDHKPNVPLEKARITQSGGTVEYLHNHNNRPFIRGGDFTNRKSRGEQPMQLQYSRAFGGKDLKMFGLSSEPDLRIFRVDPNHHVLILASDGIWDVQTAPQAVQIVLLARENGQHPALALVSATLAYQKDHNTNADNLTAVVVFLNQGKIEAYEATGDGLTTTTSS